MNQGAVPKIKVVKQSKKIVKTALANKSTEEKCKLMDMMETRKQFTETDMALAYDDSLLNIFEYIEATMFRIDPFMLNKFWQCVAENMRIHMDAHILAWLGYENEQERNQKQAFVKLLKSHNINFKQVKHTDSDFENYPDLVEEASNLSAQSLHQKKWIIMNSNDFKMMIMYIQTNRANEIRQYYLSLENLFKMYCEYTLHFQLRRERRRLDNKQHTIDDLTKELKNMRLENEKERLDAQNRHDDLMQRGDELLYHAKQTEDDLNHVTKTLHVVRDKVVPDTKNKGKQHKLGLIRKSRSYVPVDSDPRYFTRSDITVLRRQASTFNQRVNEIKNYGNGTNTDAHLLLELDNPNSINLYNRLKEERPTDFVYHNPCGIELRPGNEDELLEAVNEIHNERLDYPQ